jgi:hypothetical protein
MIIMLTLNGHTTTVKRHNCSIMAVLDWTDGDDWLLKQNVATLSLVK